ncbi:hypothetical protein [Halorubrum sp. F4]|uniref:hypothetical protein n=1 Tax=Halorubrum sp. F4 TaxID=2989715 RepID=UPI00248190DA|nr:hypothetical protein [Halorubrum sp. F4]
MSDVAANRARKEELHERCRFLRGCVPGDELHLECSDERTRSVTVDGRLEVSNGMVVLNVVGHGTIYQLNVPHDGYEEPLAPLIWRSGDALVTGVELVEESNEIWCDTTAEDLGVSER